MLPSAMQSPFATWLDAREPVLLDGGLGTELERRGHTQLGKLWSAALVRTNPAAIREVHRDYLNAGAQVISTATFQAALPVIRHTGLHRAEAEDLLRDAVALASRERDRFHHHHPDKPRPLVAASVGPFGAALCNGSEYTGRYEVSEKQLVAFHVERLRLFAESEADVIACETIPSLLEARVLLQLLTALPLRPFWLSLTCRDARHLADGSPLTEILQATRDVPNLCAIGVNCVGPRLLPRVIATLREHTVLPVLAYPNASNAWHLETRQAVDETPPAAFAQASQTWLAAGAQIIGGCCRTTPAHIAAMRDAMLTTPPSHGRWSSAFRRC